MKHMLSSLQRIGGALMLPIAVLPIAGLLLRLGQPDLLNFPSMSAAGDAIFGNLGLLFAIGVAVGLFTSVFVTRTFLRVVLDLFPNIPLWWYGVGSLPSRDKSYAPTAE